MTTNPNVPTSSDHDGVRISVHTDHVLIDLISSEDDSVLVGAAWRVLEAVAALVGAEQRSLDAIERAATALVERAQTAEREREQARDSVRRQQTHIENLQHQLHAKNSRVRRAESAQECSQLRAERDEARWELETLRATLRQLSGEAT